MVISTRVTAGETAERSTPRESAPIYGYFAPLGIAAPLVHHNYDFTTPAGRDHKVMSNGELHLGGSVFGFALGAWVGKGFAIALHGEGIAHIPVASLYGDEHPRVSPAGVAGLDGRALLAWHPGGPWNWEFGAGYGSKEYGILTATLDNQVSIEGYSVDKEPSGRLDGLLSHVGVGYTWLIEGGGGAGLLLRLDGGHFTNDGWSVTSIGPSLAFRIMMSTRR